MVPSSGLPALRRSSGVSSPWSMALRIMCTSGSAMCSTMLRSISVASPAKTKRTLLAALATEVARHARHLLEYARHRQHAHAHAHVLQVARDLGQLGQAIAHARRGGLGDLGRIDHHGLDHHQLAHHVHQVVHPFEIDLDGFAYLGPAHRLYAGDRSRCLGAWAYCGSRATVAKPARKTEPR